MRARKLLVDTEPLLRRGGNRLGIRGGTEERGRAERLRVGEGVKVCPQVCARYLLQWRTRAQREQGQPDRTMGSGQRTVDNEYEFSAPPYSGFSWYCMAKVYNVCTEFMA